MTHQRSITDGALRFWQRTDQAHWHCVAGMSMWPFFLPKDQVLVEADHPHLLAEQYQLGDVVLVQINERLIVHRITQLGENGMVTTWGDFNPSPDPIMSARQVVGRVVRIKRNGREISMKGWRRYWRPAILACRPLFVFAAYLCRMLVRLRIFRS